MVRAYVLAIGQLGDPRILRVLGLSLLVTLALFAVLGVGVDAWLHRIDCFDIGFGEICPAEDGTPFAGSLLVTLVLAWLLFPAVAIGVISGFVDRIVAAVEARHYPDAARTARRVGYAELAWLGLASAGRLLLWNLAALPFYILLLVTGIGPIILFLAVNALALGRDLPELVAVRHLDKAQRAAWLATTRARRAGLGLVAGGLFMVPLLNLLAPVLGAAAATHLFHRSRREVRT